MKLQGRLNEVKTTLNKKGIFFWPIFITATALAIGLVVSDITKWLSPVITVIVTIISIRPNIYSTVLDGIKLFFATCVGGSLALIMVMTFGYNSTIVVVAMTVSIFLAKLLNLGEDGAMNVAIAALLVIGSGQHIQDGLARLFSTLFGITLALVASYFIQSGDPIKKGQKTISRIAQHAHTLLTDIAIGIGPNIPILTRRSWIHRSHQLTEELNIGTKDMQDITLWSKWSPKKKKEQIENITKQFYTAQKTIFAIRQIISTLDRAPQGIIDEKLLSYIQDLLHSASEVVITVFTEGGEKEVQARERLGEAKKHFSKELHDLEATAPLIISGALLASLDNLAHVTNSLESTGEIPKIN